MTVWLKLGEALQANADDTRALIALSNVVSSPSQNPQEQQQLELVSSARLSLAASLANTGDEVGMRRELVSWLSSHPGYNHIPTAMQTSDSSVITTDDLVQMFIRAANMQVGGEVDVQVQNGKMEIRVAQVCQLCP